MEFQTKTREQTTKSLAGIGTLEKIITVEALEKQYSRSPVKAVGGITFTVERGEIFGLLGPNGAGKTTTIGVLTTRVLPTGGRASVVGVDVVADPVGVKPYIAVVPQRNNLDRSLTAIENLTFHAAYFGLRQGERRLRAMELLKQFGLSERAKDRVDKYSGGMAQRLLIARALMHSPQVLFLDEPTAGLDPQTRLFLWETIQTLNQEGVTVLLTTHDMEEAENLCHRVAIMQHGKILALDTPANLSKLVPAGTRIELRVHHRAALTDGKMAAILNDVCAVNGVTGTEWTTLRGQPNGSSTAASSHGPTRPQLPNPAGEYMLLRLYSVSSGEVAVKVAQIIVNAGLELADLHLARPSLEDVFIHLTGKGVRD